MSQARIQFAFLTATTMFFSLQFFPHRFTSVLATPLPLLYAMVAFLVLAMIGLFAAISIALWYLSSDLTRKKFARRWCLAFSASLCCAGGLCVANWLYCRGLPIGSFARRFDRAAWSFSGSSQFVQGDITERQKMLGDVIQSVVRDRSKAEIVESLGRPEQGFGVRSGEISYRTGPERGSLFNIDSETLIIRLDDRGRATSWRLHTD